jgi:hypothetical protein
MPKQRSVSRNFMKSHPLAGYPTHFVEKIMNSVNTDYRHANYLHTLLQLNYSKIESGKLSEQQIKHFYESLNPHITDEKHHTIRNGTSVHNGELITLYCWHNKPYNSPQVIIHAPLPVTTYAFSTTDNNEWLVNGNKVDDKNRHTISANDGLTYDQLIAWFNKPIASSQILCWNNKIKY